MKSQLLCATLAASICSLAHAAAANVYVGPSVFINQVSGNHTTLMATYPKISLGVANLTNGVYLAGELFVVPITLTLKNNHNAVASSARISNSFGASFIPGFMIANNPDVIGYARIGFITSNFSSPNVYQTGGQLGLGLQSYFARGWAVRGEYDYSLYHNMRGIGAPHVNEVGLGVIYFFGCEEQKTYDNDLYQAKRRYPIYKN